MLNQLIFCKKYNRLIRLAALLLAGVFVFFIRCLDVAAEDYNTVSGGDLGAGASVDDYIQLELESVQLTDNDIVFYAETGSLTINLNMQEMYLYDDGVYSPATATASFALDEILSGEYRVWGSFTPKLTFVDMSTGKHLNDIDLDIQFFLVIDGKKYYPVGNTLSSVIFNGGVECLRTNRIGIGYEAVLNRTLADSLQSQGNRFAGLQLYCTLTSSNLNFSKVHDLPSTILTFINAKMDTVNSSLSTIYNQIVGDNKNIYNLVSGFSNLVSQHLKNVNANLVNIYDVIDKTLINNLKTLFATNHADLQTLHTDNTTFLARFNTVYTDLRTRLANWFNRQHEDFLNLIEETTEGYDNTAGNEQNDKLSGSLGSMEEAEGQITDSASGNLDNFNPADSLSFGKGVVSGLSFVRTFANSFFNASGEFKMVVSVIYTMAFLSIIVGLWRFVRK